MLKIKDNVDLKELEKFGFEVSESKFGLCKKITKKDRRWYIDEETGKRVYDTFSNTIIVNKETREVYISVSLHTNDLVMGMGTNCEELDILYDIIKADLVKKVEDK